MGDYSSGSRKKYETTHPACKSFNSDCSCKHSCSLPSLSPLSPLSPPSPLSLVFVLLSNAYGERETREEEDVATEREEDRMQGKEQTPILPPFK